MENREEKNDNQFDLVEKKMSMVGKLVASIVDMSKMLSELTSHFITAAYRGAFLLNGAAAIAILSKKESLDDVGKIIITNGAKGALASVLASFFMYISQMYASRSLMEQLKIGIDKINSCSSSKNNIKLFINLANVFSVISFISFFVSIYFFWKSLNSLISLL